jgi:hypothetical protein
MVRTGSERQARRWGVAMPGIVQSDAVSTFAGRRGQGRQARAPGYRSLFLSGVPTHHRAMDATLPDILLEEVRVRPFEVTTLPARQVHRPFDR